MESMDPKVEQQVWQRVRGQAGPAPEREDLQALIRSAREAAAVYRYLMGSLTGRAGDQARLLWQTQQQTVACLKGIYRLSGGAGRKEKGVSAPREPAQRLLERAYFRAKKTVTEYAARELDPQFGVVFRQLARQEESQCAVIAGALGELG